MRGCGRSFNSRFLGQIVTFVGAGEVRSGVGTLASPMVGRSDAAGEQDAGRPKGQYISLKDRPQEVQVPADQAHRQNRGTALLARTAQGEAPHASWVCTCDRSA